MSPGPERMERFDRNSVSSAVSAAIKDPQRLAAVRATGLLNNAPEESFERLTRLATRDLHAPVALLSLADDRQQFFKSARGLAEPWASLQEIPLADSLSEHVVGSGMPMVITDARRHPLGQVSPEVRDLHLVAYLGVPLITPEGQSFGSFCVADYEAREWTASEIETLSDLAALAVREIVLRNSVMQSEHDASNRRRRATALGSTTEERLGLLLDAVHAGVWEWDLVSGRPIWSPEFYDLLDCDRAVEPMGAAEFVARFVHPDDRSRIESMVADLVTGREQSRRLDIEYRIIRPNGVTVWINAVGYIEQDRFHRPIRFLGFARDISDRKRAEQAQEESAQLFGKMAAVTPDYIYVIDLDEHRHICANRSFAEVLGYGDRAVENSVRWINRLMHPEDRERILAYRDSIRHLEEHAAVPTCECRFRRADGIWGWFLLRNAVFARNADGTVRQVVGTITEITALKQAENELRRLNVELEQRVAARTAELSFANHELESFAYSASHDLRAPLRAITGFSEILAEHCGEQLDPVGKHYLERVQVAAQRMGELIDALLRLSRSTRGQFDLQPVNMSALVRSIATELARPEQHRDVDIVIAEDVTVMADPVLLRIVLENLLGNAWKFTSRKEHACIEFGAQYAQHGPIFFVRDDGVGFDMEHAARMFTPFQRFHKTEEFPGTGIGLATVQRIIARHGGRIWAEGTQGTGAAFYFTLSGGNPPTGNH